MFIKFSRASLAIRQATMLGVLLPAVTLVSANSLAQTAEVPEKIASADPKTGVVDCSASLTQKHNPMLVEAAHGLVCFEGYLTKFSNWTEARDGEQATAWGVPQWTIHRVDARKRGQAALEGRDRPRSWFTVRELYDKGLAPSDENYRFSQKTRQQQANWYERGHLTQKYLAERVSPTSGRFTHNVVNAVPQRGQFNKGPWLTLECYTGAWANENTAVWIITGPIFLHELPATWLKSDSAKKPFPVAIPDALFKIVVRKGRKEPWDAMAFIYPQDHPAYKKGPWKPSDWRTSIKRIEQLTGETFSTNLKPEGKSRDEKAPLWSAHRESFDTSCKRFSAEK